MGRRSQHALFAAYVAAVTTVSLWPRQAMPTTPGFLTIPHADKFIHIAMYALMAALASLTTLRPRRLSLPAAAFLFSCTYGILLEFLQTAIRGVERTASTADALSNVGGALLGSLAFLGWQALRPAQPSQT